MSKLFVFEGIDGCGKSTQIHLSSARLSSLGVPHSVVEFPGNSHFATEVKSVLARFSNMDVPPASEAFMHLAVMLNSFSNSVISALNSSQYVLLDRFFLSTAAYQGAEDPEIASRIISTATPWFDTNLISKIFLLDIAPEKAKQRIALRGDKNDRYDDLPIPEKEKIRKRYKEALDLFPNRSEIIDANQDLNTVSDNIFAAILREINS